MIQIPKDFQDSQEIDVSLEFPCACEYMCNALKQKAPTHTCTFARIHTSTQKKPCTQMFKTEKKFKTIQMSLSNELKNKTYHVILLISRKK